MTSTISARRANFRFRMFFFSVRFFRTPSFHHPRMEPQLHSSTKQLVDLSSQAIRRAHSLIDRKVREFIVGMKNSICMFTEPIDQPP
mmetsp:Transcript_16909/g.32071  ORF Transcript_16909/g.32071 Transcript_16909/m.32071 type:complete len:87 (-) Transcript_16909:2418-2678(-)